MTIAARDYPPDPSIASPPDTWIRRSDVPEHLHCQCAFHAKWPDAPRSSITRQLEPEPSQHVLLPTKRFYCNPKVWTVRTPTALDIEVDPVEHLPKVSYETRRRELLGDRYKPKYPKSMVLPHERVDRKGVYVMRGLCAVEEGESKEDENGMRTERVDEVTGRREVSTCTDLELLSSELRHCSER